MNCLLLVASVFLLIVSGRQLLSDVFVNRSVVILTRTVVLAKKEDQQYAFNDVRQLARRAISISPDNLQAHHMAGYILLQTGDIPGAATELEKSVQLGLNTLAISRLGYAYSILGRPYDAIAVWRQLYTDRLLLQYGAQLEATGQWDEALASYEAAAEVKPTRGATFYKMGLIWLHHKSDADAALVQFKRTIEVEPGFIWAYLRIGDIYRARDKYDHAAYWYLQAPRTEAVALALGLNSLAAGDTESAIAYLNEALEISSRALHPQFPPAHLHYNLALALEASGDWTKAAEEYEWAVQNQPGNAQYLRALANLYYRRQNIDKALATYQRLLVIEPGDGEAMSRLAELRVHHGQ